ncbi:unnamed protein product [Phaedon cochleariae]|uniref:Uncharacterized protein n=1 Tax=Phaedon cochleariae TaxID=80249 RepID=A0A9N9SK02_PHACE|nr:unnamed protein product [Phaedon cochleariae]
MKRAVLLNGLSEETFKLLDDLVLPEKAETTAYEDLIKQLDGYFSQEKLVLAERFNFYSAKKGKTESYSEYLARLNKGLAVYCEFGPFLKRVLRDKFITGLEAGPVLDKLLQEKVDVTVEKALQIAHLS